MTLTELALIGCLIVSAGEGVPRMFLADGEAFVAARAKVRQDDPAYADSLAALRKAADEALQAGPFSVMDKPFVPESGDKHDYMSVGPYWWPDPKKKDGLPYIRKDGVVNPERNEYDNVGMGKMTRAVKTLARAYWFTGEEKYAERATLLLRTWFLDEATRMNPNLNFGQAIPGRVSGRGIGIIDTPGLTHLLDAVGLLAESKAWTEADQAGLVQWFKDYTHWLTTHKYGIDESKTRNNHATWYDVQVAHFAFFTGDTALAKRVLSEVGKRRIAKQIEPDGRQPHELARTKSYGYSVMNLRGMFALARLGDHAGIDLWHYETPDGRGMRKALDWILEHAFGDGEWTYQNLSPIKASAMAPLLRDAVRAYPDGGYDAWCEKLKCSPTPDIVAP